MNACLYCDEEINQPLTWTSLFLPTDPTPLCETCKKELEVIDATICQRCGRPMKEQKICNDCHMWLSHAKYKDAIQYNRSLFTFNPFTQQVITQWKYRGDYQLKEVISYPIKRKLAKHYPIKELTIVPIPLSEERQYERAFNQTEAIANLIKQHYNRPVYHVLKRNPNSTEKQSKKNKKQRINSKNPFILTNSLETGVLLVDDIYTTGMTIHHAASLLKDAGCPAIYSFTLIR